MTTTDVGMQLTTFFLNGEEYAVDVMQVREIIGMTEITKSANAPHYVEGLINLRGTIVPIISLRKRLGLPSGDSTASSCIAVMDFGGQLTGFIIDEISDVIRIKHSDIEPPTVALDQPWIRGIINNGTGMTVLVDLNHLV